MRSSTRVFLAALALSLPSLASSAEPCKVNVHTCTVITCAYLPGVGEKTAALISAAHPADLAALDGIKGIGEKKLEGMKPFLAFAGETTCTAKQRTRSRTVAK